MNKNKSGKHTSSDANMDALLKEFFDKEMPAELRGQTEMPLAVSRHGSRSEVRTADSRKAGWLGLSVGGGCLLTVVVALSLPSSQQLTDSDPSVALPAVSDSTDSSGHAEATAVDIDSSGTTDGVEVVERYDTVNGPVEQRSKLRIKNVSIYDPETGSKVELLLPELDIEIFPIEDDGSEDGKNGEGE